MTYTIYINDNKTAEISNRNYAIQLLDFYASLICNNYNNMLFRNIYKKYINETTIHIIIEYNMLFKKYIFVKHKLYFI